MNKFYDEDAFSTFYLIVLSCPMRKRQKVLKEI